LPAATALAQGIVHQKLELADLVAAEAEAVQIVTLAVELYP